MHSGVLFFRKIQVKILKDLECGGLKKPTENMRSCLYAQNFKIYREGETDYTAQRKVTLHTQATNAELGNLCYSARLLTKMLSMFLNSYSPIN